MQKSYQAKTQTAAFNQAKDAYGIPSSAQPVLTVKPNTPLGNELGLDVNRNGELYLFEVKTGLNGAPAELIAIRRDFPAPYGTTPQKGDQAAHYNADVVKLPSDNPKDINRPLIERIVDDNTKNDLSNLDTHFFWE